MSFYSTWRLFWPWSGSPEPSLASGESPNGRTAMQSFDKSHLSSAERERSFYHVADVVGGQVDLYGDAGRTFMADRREGISDNFDVLSSPHLFHCSLSSSVEYCALQAGQPGLFSRPVYYYSYLSRYPTFSIPLHDNWSIFGSYPNWIHSYPFICLR